VANINVAITYNPSGATGNQWSLTATGTTVNGTTIEVNDRGANPIQWSIGMAEGASGSINFSTTSTAPGIQFTGSNAWTGDPPIGNSNIWNSSLNNTLGEGAPSQTFEYRVNAVYTPPGKGANPTNVSWDPDVEENPPAQLVVKRR
jgi:hypothetical protein